MNTNPTSATKTYRGTMPIPVYMPEAPSDAVSVVRQTPAPADPDPSPLSTPVIAPEESLEGPSVAEPVAENLPAAVEPVAAAAVDPPVSDSLNVLSGGESLDSTTSGPSLPTTVVDPPEPPKTPRNRGPSMYRSHRKGLISTVLLAVLLIGGGLGGLLYARYQAANKGAVQPPATVSPTSVKLPVAADSLVTLNGSLKVAGQSSLGKLSVSGIANLLSDLNLSGNLAASGNGSFNGSLSSAQLQAINLIISGNATVAGSLQAGLISGTFQGTYNGNGQGLTGVDAVALNGQPGSYYTNASNLSSGTLDDSRLSGNVALRNADNTFSGANSFSAGVSLQGPLVLSQGDVIDDGAGGISFSVGGRTYSLPTSGAANQVICTTAVTCASGAGSGVILGPSSAQDNASGNSAVFINNSAGGNLLRLQGNGVDKFVVDAGGNLTATSLSGDGTNVTNVNAAELGGQTGGYYQNASNLNSGTLSDSRLSTNVALQDGTNTFSGVNTFANAGNSFAGDGSGLTNVNAAQLGGQAGSYYTNASNLSAGTLDDARLNADVTLQGNAFNGPSELVQLTAGGALPALDGSNLSNVNAASLQGYAASYFVNASNLSSGTLSDSRLSANVALLDATNSFTGATNSFIGLSATSILQNGYSVCDTSGNCAGVGGGVTTTGGQSGYLAMFTGAGSIADSLVSQSGSTVTVAGTLSAGYLQGDGSAINNLDGNNITSGTVGVGYGGTGANSFTKNGIVYGNGSGQLQATDAGTTGSCLVATTNSAPSWQSCTSASGGASPGGAAGGDLSGNYPNPTVSGLSGTALSIASLAGGDFLLYDGTNWVNQAIGGDLSVTANGTATIADGAVTNAKLQNSSLSVLAGIGLNGGGVAALGGSTTLNVVYGDTAGTAVAGGTTLICPSGSGNLSGGGNTITLGDGGSCSNLTVTPNPSFTSLTLSTALAVSSGGTGSATASGARTNLGAAAAGANSDITSLSGLTTALSTGQGGTGLDGSTAANGQLLIGNGSGYTLANIAQGSGISITNGAGSIQIAVDNTVCTTAGNCVGTGSGGSIGGAGTAGTIAVFTGSGFTVGDSLLSQTGSTVSVAGTLSATALQGDGSGITNLDASNLASGTVASARLSGAYGGITGVGALLGGSIGSGFGAISTTNAISTTAELQGNTLAIGNGSFTVSNTGAITAATGLTASGSINFSSLNAVGVVHTDASGNLSTSAVILGTDTSGSYVANLGTLTGLTATGNSGAGSMPSLSVTYGAAVNTAAQGNTTLSFTGSGNLTGTVSGTAGGGFASNTLDVVTNPTFSGLVTANGGLSATDVTFSGALTQSGNGTITLGSLGAGIVQTNSSGVISSGALDRNSTSLTGQTSVANGGTGASTAGNARTNLGAAASGANSDITSLSGLTTALSAGQGGTGLDGSTAAAGSLLIGNGNGYTLANLAQGSGISITNGAGSIQIAVDNTVCTTAGNCAGAGTGVTTSGGTIGAIALFTGSQAIGDSILAQSGSTLTAAGTIVADYLQGDGSGLINLNAGNLASGTVASARLSGNYGGITGTGALSAGSIATGFGVISTANAISTTAALQGNSLAIGTGNFAVSASGTVSGATGITSSGTINFTSLNSVGVVHADASGTLSTSAVILGTETSGSYVATLGTLTGLTATGNSGAGSTPTLSVTYGAAANTAAQGNTALSFSGTGNLTGTVSGTAGAGISSNTLAVVTNPTFSGLVTANGGLSATDISFSGALTQSGTGTITLGSLGAGIVQTDSSGVISSGTLDRNSTNLTGQTSVANGGTGSATAAGARTNLGAAAAGANHDITSLTGLTTALSAGQGGTGLDGSSASAGQLLIGNGSGYSLANLTQGSGISITNGAGSIQIAVDNTVCTTAGNCAGAGTGVTTSGGTIGAIALFTGSQAIGDSILSQSGSTVSVAGTLSATALQGDGSLITSLNATNLSSGTVASARLSGAYGGISGVGALSVGSIVTGFGSISTTNSISTTAALQGNSLTIASGAFNVNNTGAITAASGLTASGAIDFSSLNAVGVIHTDANGNLSTSAVILGTDTSGSFVANLGALTGLTATGNSGAGSTPTLSVTYGAAANTAAQGNTALSFSGTGNLTGTVSGTAGAGISSNTLAVVTNPTFSGLVTANGGLSATDISFSGDLTQSGSGTITFGSLGAGLVQTDASGVVTSGSLNRNSSELTGTTSVANGGTGASTAVNARTNLAAAASGANSDITSLSDVASIYNTSAALTLGAAGQGLILQGNASTTLSATGSGFTTTVGFVAPTADVTYQFDTAGTGTYTICTSVGNCAGAGAGVTTTGGIAGAIALFTGSQALGNSILSQSGTTVSVGGTLSATALQGDGSALTGLNGDNIASGTVGVSVGGTGAHNFTSNGVLYGAGTAAIKSTTAGSTGQCLVAISGGAPVWQDCTSAAGGSAPGGAAGGDLSGSYPNPIVTGLSGTPLSITSLSAGDLLFYDGTQWLNEALSGDLTVSAAGVATIANGAVTNDDLEHSSLEVIAGTGLSGGGSAALGGSTTLSVTYGSAAGTAAQGNVTFVCPTGTGNLSGGGNTITIGTGGSCNNLTVVANPSFSSLTLATPLAISSGGTGATTASGARTSLGAAASGANSDITSISGLTTALSVTQGGTGQTSFTANGVLYGTGTGHLQVTAAGSTGQCLVSSTGSAPVWTDCDAAASGSAPGGAAGGDLSGDYPNPQIAKLQGTALSLGALSIGQVILYDGTDWINQTVSGDFTMSGTGVATITNGAVTNAKLANSIVTITAGTGLTGGGNVALGDSTSLNVAYGSVPGTAVQGDITLTCPSGTGNLTGTGNSITLGTGGSCNTIGIVANPNFTTSVTTPLLASSGTLALSAGGAHIITLSTNSLERLRVDDSGNVGIGTTVTGSYKLTVNGSANATTLYQNGNQVCDVSGNCSGANAGSGDTAYIFNGTTAQSDASFFIQPTAGNTGGVIKANGSGDLLDFQDVNGNVVASVDANGNLMATSLSGDGTNVTNVNAAQLNGQAGSYYQNATNIVSGTLDDARLNNDVTLQGNAFNNAGELVQLDGSGDLPALNGSALLSLNASALASGTVGSARLSGSYTGVTGVGALSAGSITSGFGTISTGNAISTTAALQGNTLSIGGGSFTVSAVGAITAASGITSSGTITFSGLNAAGVLHTDASGQLSTSAVVLGSDTSGTYVSKLGSLTGLTLGGTNNVGGAVPTLSVIYGSVANTAAQGNAALSFSGGGNLTGTVSGTAGGGFSANTLDVVSNPTFSGLVMANGGLSATSISFSGSLTQTGSGAITLGSLGAGIVQTSAAGVVSSGTLDRNSSELTGQTSVANGGTGSTTASGARTNLGAAASGANSDITSLTKVTSVANSAGSLSVGASGQALTLQGNASTVLSATDSGYTTTVGFVAPTANVTYRFDAVTAGTYDICTSIGNCASAGGGVTTTGGTAGTIALFTGSQAIGNSILSQAGTTVTVAGTLSATALQGSGASITNLNGTNIASGTVGVSVGGTGAGSFTSHGIIYGNGTGVLQVTAAGTTGQCLTGVTSGAPVWTSCTTAAGGATPGGAAGGDLSGSYPNPQVSGLYGTPLLISNLASSNMLIYNGTDWTNETLNGDLTVSATGVATIGAGKVTNADLANSSLTVTAGTGLTGGGLISLGGSATLNVTYGSTAGTAAQGNTSLGFSGGSNLTGSVTGTAGGGLTSTLAVANNPTFSGLVTASGGLSATTGSFSGTVTIQGTTTLGTIGTTAGQLTIASSHAGGSVNIITSGSQANAVTITIPTDANSTDTICLVTLGNCSGANGGSGDTNYIFNGTSPQAADFDITRTGTIGGTLTVGGVSSFTSGSSSTPGITFSANSATGLTTGTSGTTPNDALRAVGNSLGANFQTQNTNGSGYSGVEYVTNGGTVGVFSGLNNSNGQEFRFNNILSGGYINFMINSSTKLQIQNDGDISIADNLTVGGSASATSFTQNGHQVCDTSGNCTGVSGGAIGGGGTAGTIPLFTGSGYSIGNSILTQASTTVTAAGTLAASYLQGDGSGITNLNASHLASGTVASGLLSGVYGGITGVGTLGSLNVSGALTVTAAGNSAFTGTVSGADATANNQFATLGQLNTAVSSGSGDSNYIFNQSTLQSSANFNIDGTGKAANFNATTALQTGGVTRLDASGNLTAAAGTFSGTLSVTGDTTVSGNFSAGSITANNGGTTYNIGDTGPGGGIIFYDKGDNTGGWRYLEAAPSDQSTSSAWCSNSSSLIGANGTAIGTGTTDTATMLANCSSGAANVATSYNGGGKTDWFLPSKDELSQLYTKKGVVGGFASNYYWSSSEGDVGDAWMQYFVDGTQYNNGKASGRRVRVIREVAGPGTVTNPVLYVDNTNGRVGLGTSTPGYMLDVQGGSGIVGQFSGRVIGADAVNNNEYTTLGQVNSLISASGAGGGVTSLNSLTGALAIQGNSQIGVTPSGSNVNLSIQAGSIGNTQLQYATGQALTTTSSPTFGGLTVSGTVTAAALQGASLDTATAGVLNIGGTNATGITLGQTTTIKSGSYSVQIIPNWMNEISSNNPFFFTSNLYFGVAGTPDALGTYGSTSDLQLVTGQSNVGLTVKASNSYVGVAGNTAPSYPLDVTGDINTSTTYRVSGTAGTTQAACGSGYVFSPITTGGIVTGGSCTSVAAGSGSGNYIQNGTGLQSSANFNIDGTGKAANFNATTALQTAGVTRVDASGNLTNIGNIGGSGTLQLSGTSGTSYIMSSLGLGTTSPQAGSALTIANGAWLSAVNAGGSGYVNILSVNANDEIQLGAALNVDGGIILPTDAGQVTLSDLPIDSSATAGTPESYTLRVGSGNVLTVYGEADGAGNLQNGRVAIGGSISPQYTLDVGGDINTSTGYRVGGTAGTTATCSGGQVLQNQVVQGGITTGGSCATIGGGGSGVTTVGALDGGTANANGATISGTTLYLQSASGSNAGLVNGLAQTFAGAKTFSSSATFSSGLTTSALSVNGTPSGTNPLLVLGTQALQNGNASGQYLGVNVASNYSGDILHFENQGVVKFVVGNTGNLTAAGTVTGNLVNSVTGYQLNGVQVTSSILSDSANLAKLNGTQTFTGTNTFSGAFTVSASTAHNFNIGGLVQSSCNNSYGFCNLNLSTNLGMTGPSIQLEHDQFYDQVNVTGNTVFTSAPPAVSYASLIQLGSAIQSGNAATNGGTYLGLNESASGAGSAADFLNFQVNGSSKLLVDNGGNITGASLKVGAIVGTASGSAAPLRIDASGALGVLRITNVGVHVLGNTNPSYPLDVQGDINTSTAYRVGGTAGTTATCSGGQVLQNQVVTGGITTGGTCATIGGGGSGVTTIGTLDGGTANANGATISGTALYLQSANGSTPGLVNGSPQTFAGAKTFTDLVALSPGSGTALAVTTAPTASATNSLVRLGATDIQGGSANGTYLGINAASGYSGDFLNFQVNGGSKLKVDNTGAITAASLAANGAITAQGGSFVVNSSSVVLGSVTTLAWNSGVLGLGSGSNYISLGGTPYAYAGDSLVSLGANEISGGNAATNGGTYLGLNESASGAGSAADFLNFQVNGSSKLKVDNTGYITAGSLSVSQVRLSGTQALTFSGTALQVGDHSYWQSLGLYTNGTQQFGLDASGNGTLTGNLTVQGTGNSSFAGKVGIGTTSPSVLLDVETTATNTPAAHFYTGGGGTDVSIGANSTTAINIGHNGGGLNIYGTNSGAGGFNIAGQSSALNLSTDSNSNAITLQAGTGTGNIILKGSVGIGTSTPGQKLDVTGNINASGSYYDNGTAGTTATCSGGQVLQNQVVTGGITTGGTCATIGGGGSGVTTIGTLDGGTANANGATISGTALYLQSANGSTPGLVNGLGQTFAGDKIFSGNLTTQSNLSASGSGTFGSNLTVSGSSTILHTTLSVDFGTQIGGTLTVTSNGSPAALVLSGTPGASATSSLIRVGNAISGGNAVTNGGTYIGLNAPSSGAGSAADLLNLQRANVSLLELDSSGNLTVGNTLANSYLGTGSLDVNHQLTVDSAGCSLTSSIDSSNSSATIATNGGACYALSINNLANGGISINNTAQFAANGNLTLSATNATAFLVQNTSSAALLTANTSAMQVVVGTTSNGLILSATSGITANGTARHTKTITLPAEYAGAVLDSGSDSTCTSANSGTMTSGLDLTNKQNYYSWTSTSGSAQCYDVAVQVPIPSDFSAWATNPLTIGTYTTNTGTGTLNLDVRDTAGAQVGTSFASITPGSANTWSTNTTTSLSGTYTPGSTMTIRLRLSAASSASVRAGTITLTYLSSF